MTIPTDVLDRMAETARQTPGLLAALAPEESSGQSLTGSRRLPYGLTGDPEKDIEIEAYRLKIRDAAREQRDTEAADKEWREPVAKRLDEMFREPDVDTPYLIDGLWPEGGRVLFSGAAKAGKTTLTANVIRSLVDGVPFLGKFEVRPPEGQVILLNFELSEPMMRRWFRDFRLDHPERVTVYNLQGQASAFNVRNKRIRQRWVDMLRKQGSEDGVLILDPIGKVLDATGGDENENATVGPLLDAVDELADTAGCQAVFVVHHYGHGGRTRGASKFLGWPDAIWDYRKGDGKQKPPDSEDDLLSSLGDLEPRFLRATGRDVEVPWTMLEYDRESRRLTAREPEPPAFDPEPA